MTNDQKLIHVKIYNAKKEILDNNELIIELINTYSIVGLSANKFALNQLRNQNKILLKTIETLKNKLKGISDEN